MTTAVKSGARKLERSFWRALARTLILVIPLSFISQMARADDSPVELNSLIGDFDQYVLLNLNGTRVAVKWKRDTALVIAGKLSPELLAYIGGALVEVQNATQHNIAISTEKANFYLLFSQSIFEDIEKNKAIVYQFFHSREDVDNFVSRFKAEGWPCGVKIVAANGEISGVVGLISTSRDLGTQKQCVDFALANGMGLDGDAMLSISDFAHLDSRLEIKSRYLYLMSILYMNDIKPGATRNEVTDALRKMTGKGAN